MKVGRPVFRSCVKQARGHVVSDCPLAAQHIVQEVQEMAAKDGKELPVRRAGASDRNVRPRLSD